MLREVAAAEDRAIYDAWQNGGEYKGEAVNDATLLKHVRGRRDNLDKNDPLWDHWSNEAIQLDFRIGEEKVILAYNEGKVGKGAVVAFYRKQLGSIAKDSAFYRDVAGRAAQWAKQDVAANRARARDALDQAQKDRLDQAIAVQARADDVEYYIQYAAAKEYGYYGDITQMDATDLDSMLTSGLVRDGSGRTIGMNDLVDSQQAKYSAFNTLIDASEKLGRSTMGLRKDQREYIDHIQRINAVDDRAMMEIVDDNFNGQMEFCAGNPSCELKALQSYQEKVSGIIASAEAAHGNDTNWALFIGAAKNRLRALNGEPVNSGVENIANALGAITNDDIRGIAISATQNYQGLVSGQLVWGQTEPGGELKLIQNAVNPLTGAPQVDPTQAVSIQIIGGEPVNVLMVGTPVYANGVLSPDGKTVIDPGQYEPGQIAAAVASGAMKLAGDGQIVGYIYSDASTGKRSFGVVGPDNTIKYVNENPFNDSLSLSGDGKSLTFYMNGTLEANALNDSTSKSRVWRPAGDPSALALGANWIDPATGKLKVGLGTDYIVDDNIPFQTIFALSQQADQGGNRQQGIALNQLARQLQTSQYTAQISNQVRDNSREKAPPPDMEHRRLAFAATQQLRGTLDTMRSASKDDNAFAVPTIRSKPQPGVAEYAFRQAPAAPPPPGKGLRPLNAPPPTPVAPPPPGLGPTPPPAPRTPPPPPPIQQQVRDNDRPNKPPPPPAVPKGNKAF